MISTLKAIIESQTKCKCSSFYNVLLISWVLFIQVLNMWPGQWYGPVIKFYDYNYKSNATFAGSDGLGQLETNHAQELECVSVYPLLKPIDSTETEE